MSLFLDLATTNCMEQKFNPMKILTTAKIFLDIFN